MPEHEYKTESNSTSPTIAHLVLGCVQCFRDTARVIKANESARADTTSYDRIEDLSGRFRVWTGNIAAHREGKSSLDYRLRDASHIRQRVFELLKDLSQSLEDASAIVDGSKVPWDELSDTTTQTDASDASSNQASELEQIMESLGEILNCLFQLSMAIRNPTPHDHYLNSSSVATSEFEQFDKEHVLNKFPSAEPDIIERLGRAITRRRNYLKYRELRHRKLSGGIADVGLELPDDHDTGSTVATTLATRVATRENWDDLDGALSDRSDFSETSYATSAGISGALRPPRPPIESHDGQPFECPLCFFVITVGSDKSWRRHVYQDLHPYVCTFPKCETPNKIFASQHLWFSHEMNSHRSTWQCPEEGCTKVFTALTHLRNHVSDATREALNEDFGKCRQDVPMLTVAACPLCGETQYDLVQLRHHVTRHQQQLALFALPLSSFPEEQVPDSDLSASPFRSGRLSSEFCGTDESNSFSDGAERMKVGTMKASSAVEDTANSYSDRVTSSRNSVVAIISNIGRVGEGSLPASSKMRISADNESNPVGGSTQMDPTDIHHHHVNAEDADHGSDVLLCTCDDKDEQEDKVYARCEECRRLRHQTCCYPDMSEPSLAPRRCIECRMSRSPLGDYSSDRPVIHWVQQVQKVERADASHMQLVLSDGTRYPQISLEGRNIIEKNAPTKIVNKPKNSDDNPIDIQADKQASKSHANPSPSRIEEADDHQTLVPLHFRKSLTEESRPKQDVSIRIPNIIRRVLGKKTSGSSRSRSSTSSSASLMADIFPTSRMPRGRIEAETLRHYKIIYQLDLERTNYVFLKPLSEEDFQVLYEHSSKIRRRRTRDKTPWYWQLPLRLHLLQDEDIKAFEEHISHEEVMKRDGALTEGLAECGYTPQEIHRVIELNVMMNFGDDQSSPTYENGIGEQKHISWVDTGRGGQQEHIPTKGTSMDVGRRIPVYAKIHKKYLDVDTLAYYNLPYENDVTDPDYLIILKEMDETKFEMLFKHTRRMRKFKSKLLVESSKSKPEGKYPWVHMRPDTPDVYETYYRRGSPQRVPPGEAIIIDPEQPHERERPLQPRGFEKETIQRRNIREPPLPSPPTRKREREQSLIK